MTKQDAIKWLQSLKKDIGKTEHQDLWYYEQAIDEIIEALEQEPKRGKWIPVSERLPDKFIDCLITVKTDLGELYTCVSRWSSVSDKQEFNAFCLPKECFINNSKYMVYQPVPEGNVIAWMPLPEPYERSDEE